MSGRQTRLKEHGGEMPLPQNMITIMRGTEECLGVLTDLSGRPAEAARVEFERPGAFLPMARPLFSDYPADRQACGDTSRPASSTAIVVNDACVSPGKGVLNKVQSRLEALKTSATSALRVFSAPTWNAELRESSCTQTLSRTDRYGCIAVMRCCFFCVADRHGRKSNETQKPVNQHTSRKSYPTDRTYETKGVL